jgi:RNA polymerase sigma-70 factor (ECF subfamily)
MSAPSVHTTQVRLWLERMRAGDRSAHAELLRSVGDRLERLTRKMLRSFPRVHGRFQTGDVLQNSLLRLLRALEAVDPASTREFFSLAAVQIRRELLDLARRIKRMAYETAPVGGNHGSDAGPEPVDERDDPDDLEKWTQLHQEVENLPAEEREVVSLIIYHDWTQAEVAELFQVTTRTVQRHWRSALRKLHHVLHEEDLEA